MICKVYQKVIFIMGFITFTAAFLDSNESDDNRHNHWLDDRSERLQKPSRSERLHRNGRGSHRRSHLPRKWRSSWREREHAEMERGDRDRTEHDKSERDRNEGDRSEHDKNQRDRSERRGSERRGSERRGSERGQSERVRNDRNHKPLRGLWSLDDEKPHYFPNIRRKHHSETRAMAPKTSKRKALPSSRHNHRNQ